MPNALIYSPDLDGHRQLYVFVISHLLKKSGFKIFVAGNLKVKITNAFYVDLLREDPAISIIDTCDFAGGGFDISNEDLRKLQQSCNAGLTVLAEADYHLSLLTSQIYKKQNKLQGRTIGIFMRPFSFYRENPFLDKLRFIKNISSRWNKDERVFFEFFLKRFSLLDVALSIDEKLVRQNPQFTWMPDVFQHYADKIVQPDERADQRLWIKKLNDFQERNKGKFFLLYFGTAQTRRGYDNLLKLAEETGDCFIHCGLKNTNLKFTYNTEEIILKLKQEGRYFETNEFIEDPFTIQYFFKSISHLVLPYKNFHGSSGVMLQALELGIPVLAPDTAIMGYRIKKHGLGLTYEDSNMQSLSDQFKVFKHLEPKTFKQNIENYMRFQTTEQLENVLVNAITGSEAQVLLP